ncbi:cell wall-binding repeat-containing protein [Clostridium sp. 'White wine YQ']|uniref:cell wall-binding repeat-containing protein n=1 Tax=Clostridium sp. 'White wine YQ' TaxID=3027474 RepID=UPI00236540D3|nr:cell wall-binding repeat-containing protein [Clostridium sp. 'White wine YQ']MDD7794540.1 cell wall-binding repeat-containing protein [Clostridium sp. 'White wine YQ']
MKKKMIFLTILFSSILIQMKTAHAVEVDSIKGKDRYETAYMIAQKMNYTQAILVNGYSIVDGLSASGLSGTTDSPILLTEKDSIPEKTLDGLKSVNKVYIVGGEGVISKNVERILNMRGISTERLGGADRYATSIAVANKIEATKGIQQVFYVNGDVGQADAMSISPEAAKSKNPIILTNGISTGYKRNVDSYSIGGQGVIGAWFDTFTTRIGGKSRFETNKEVIDYFFPNRNHVYLSKSEELIDALTSSVMKEPVVLVENYSDKTVLAGAKSFTSLGDINSIAIGQAKGYIYKEKVVFYSQHQDDEVLFAGSAIVDAIESVGRENVYLVVVSDGDESGVLMGDRYKNLTVAEKATLRNNELKAADEQLGLDLNNIIFLNEPESNCNYDDLSKIALEFENKFTNVTHVAHTYKFDIHPQHLKCGQTIYNLYKEGKIKDCKFFARTEKANEINPINLILNIAYSNEEKDRVLKASKEYKLDRKDMIREGIGYKSVPGLFDALEKDKYVTSYLHEPGI